MLFSSRSITDPVEQLGSRYCVNKAFMTVALPLEAKACTSVTGLHIPGGGLKYASTESPHARCVFPALP